MRKITTADRLRYYFDNTMSRGTIALIGWLFLISLILILVASILIAVSGAAPAGEDGSPDTFLEVMWLSLMHTMDAGALGGDNMRGNLFFLLAMTIVTFGGVFVFSTLIGVLNSGIEARLDELRKGRSFVVETDHTIILGWSPQVFAILSELIIANASRPRSCIAILAEKDKVEMEDEIRSRIENTGNTRIVCRTGSPIDMGDLEIVNPNGSRSIIVLSQESANPDSHVIKTLLALLNHPRRRQQPYHIVAEIRDPMNLEVAQMVGRDEVRLLLVGDLISRIAVQTSRQSGLSVLYTELLDFGGDEIYFKQEPSLAGKSFGDALFAYDTSSVIGVYNAKGEVKLNPPSETPLAAGDSLIVIAADDSTIRLSGKTSHPVDASAIQTAVERVKQKERTLILGWNKRGVSIINELDSYVSFGSEVMVIAELPEAEAEIEENCRGVCQQKITFRLGNTTDRRMLDSLDIPSYNHVITLSYSDTLDPQEADARTLVTLLHLRDIQEKTGKDISIVSEMLDMRNRELADVTRADDFIISDKLVSLMMSQLSENRDLMDVFEDLFDPEGAEFYLYPAEEYVTLGKPVNSYTIVEAARRRGEIAVGYRILSEAADVDRHYGLHINPNKAESVSFREGDRIIVLAGE